MLSNRLGQTKKHYNISSGKHPYSPSSPPPLPQNGLGIPGGGESQRPKLLKESIISRGVGDDGLRKKKTLFGGRYNLDFFLELLTNTLLGRELCNLNTYTHIWLLLCYCSFSFQVASEYVFLH